MTGIALQLAPTIFGNPHAYGGFSMFFDKGKLLCFHDLT